MVRTLGLGVLISGIVAGVASPAFAAEPAAGSDADDPLAGSAPAADDPAGDPTAADASAGTDDVLGTTDDTADDGYADDSADDSYADDTADEPDASVSASASTNGGTIVAADGEAGEGGTGLIDPFKRRFSLGVIRTIAGLNGLNARFFVSDKFAIGLNLGVALAAYKDDPEDPADCPGEDCNLQNTRTVARLGSSIEALYYAKLGREAGQLPFRADFALGGRFGVIGLVNASDIADNLDDPTEIHIEIPLIINLMFGNHFALAPEFGMDFLIIPGSREDGDSNPGFAGNPTLVSADATSGPAFGWQITPGVGLFAGASMHYIF